MFERKWYVEERQRRSNIQQTEVPAEENQSKATEQISILKL